MVARHAHLPMPAPAANTPTYCKTTPAYSCASLATTSHRNCRPAPSTATLPTTPLCKTTCVCPVCLPASPAQQPHSAAAASRGTTCRTVAYA